MTQVISEPKHQDEMRRYESEKLNKTKEENLRNLLSIVTDCEGLRFEEVLRRLKTVYIQP